jgi:hypothetical protein
VCVYVPNRVRRPLHLHRRCADCARCSKRQEQRWTRDGRTTRRAWESRGYKEHNREHENSRVSGKRAPEKRGPTTKAKQQQCNTNHKRNKPHGYAFVPNEYSRNSEQGTQRHDQVERRWVVQQQIGKRYDLRRVRLFQEKQI